ncbi:unnamed protein product [Arabis nemorensis]|uniref:DRBM domain-containing protein n=1 Tax=Arabis nemorensis TaxID=586526 RepID=A0A565CIU2_9BRAS|nr:unnamed protein product [Arabis nemorensis]
MFPISSSPPPQAMVIAPYRTPSPPRPRVVEKLMHKNDLNCYCQRLSIPMPVYESTSEGYDHAPRYRATVSVGKRSFTSQNMFSNRKSAEQDAAKVALQHLLDEDEANATKLRLYLRKLVCQEKVRSKMILNEFLVKNKMECIYKTVQVENPPVFVSSLALNGTCYKGKAAKNKKETEQLAALAAILSLLDDPTYATMMYEVLKSKFSVCSAFYEPKDIPNTRDCSVTSNEFKATTSNSDVIPLNQQNSSSKPSSSKISVNEKLLQANNTKEQRSSEILVNKNKQDLAMSLPQIEKQGAPGALNGTGLPTEAVTISRSSYVNLPVTRLLFSEPQHGTKMPSLVNLEEQRGSAILVNMSKQDLVKSLPQTEKQGGREVLDGKRGDAGLPTEAVTISRCSYVSPSITRPLFSKPQHKTQLPEPAQSTPQQISVPIEFVPAAASDPPYDPISCRKRERNKKRAEKRKANKRLRTENK